MSEQDPFDKAHAIKIESFTAETLFETDGKTQPIIEEFLYERDVVMMLGSEKSGKSLIAMQMGMEISTGGKLFDKYQCTQKKVLYLQTEGKKDETVDRMLNMAQVIKVDSNFFVRSYKKFCPLNVPEYLSALELLFEEKQMYDGVFILDCLYMAMVGDLNDNEDVRDFISALSYLLEKFRLTCIFVHHSKRSEYIDGKEIKKGDKSSYGSVFLRANIDHILFLDMCGKTKVRTLSCDTQRSGKIAEPESLILIEPSPLHFKILGDKMRNAKEESIMYHLSKSDLSKDQLIELTKIPKRTIDGYIKSLLSDSLIDVVDEVKAVHGSNQKIYGKVKQLAPLS